jgi:hypothetical protein
MTWEAATDIIWLDYPIYIVLWRLWFRTIERIRSGVKLWGMEGCVETWQSQFLSRDSLLYVSPLWELRIVYGCFGFIGIDDPYFMKIWYERKRDRWRVSMSFGFNGQGRLMSGSKCYHFLFAKSPR